MKLILRSITIFLICFISKISFGFADQHDLRLNSLFVILQTPLSAVAVNKIEQQIWAHWSAFPDDQETEAMMIAGIRMLEAGQPRMSETVFSQIIKRQPNFSEAWNKRATARFLIGDHIGSLRDILNVLKLEPRHFGALCGLGMIHMRAGSLERSLKAYKAAFAIHPNLINVKKIIVDLKERLKGQLI
jgi:tetratricopeptide (TPR) repeat protein